MSQIIVEKISDEGHFPTRASDLSAGLDLKSSEKVCIPALGREIINTGIKIKLPEECYGRIAPRSGLAINHGIIVGAGVVDNDYTGEIKVVLFNLSAFDYEVNVGDRIAQLICEKIYLPSVVEGVVNNDTTRSESGFGSSGIQ